MNNNLFNGYYKLCLNLWLQLNKAIIQHVIKKVAYATFYHERETGLEPATLSLGS